MAWAFCYIFMLIINSLYSVPVPHEGNEEWLNDSLRTIKLRITRNRKTPGRQPFNVEHNPTEVGEYQNGMMTDDQTAKNEYKDGYGARTCRNKISDCSQTYEPLCGSNHVTYINKCHMDAARCEDRSISLSYRGRCRTCNRRCFRSYGTRVCGSNGKTYGDVCHLKVAQCRDATVTLQHYGKCIEL